MGEDAWTHLLSNGRTIGNTRGTHALTIFSCVTYTSLKVTNKLGLSFGSTKELNDIVDKALPGRPPFETHEVVVEGETLELHSRNILECIRSIYGDCYVTAGTFARRGLSSTAKTLRNLVWCARVFRVLSPRRGLR